MANFIVNKKTRLRVKQWEAPLTGDKILGKGIDITTCPDGHLSCPQCARPQFECWVYSDKHYIEIGCIGCGWSERILLPYDVDLSKRFGEGRFTCFRHPTSGMIIIKNTDKLCIGCQFCKTQVILDIQSKSNLIIAQ